MVSFPDITLDGMKLKFVSSFRYLGHIVQNNECDDDDDDDDDDGKFETSSFVLTF